MKPFVRDGVTFGVFVALLAFVLLMIRNETNPPHAHLSALMPLLYAFLVLVAFVLSALGGALGFAVGSDHPGRLAPIAAAAVAFVLVSLGLLRIVPLSGAAAEVVLMAAWQVVGSAWSAWAVTRRSRAAVPPAR